MKREELNNVVCCKSDVVIGINMGKFEELIQQRFSEILAFEVEEEKETIYLVLYVDKKSERVEQIIFEIIANTVWLESFSCKKIATDESGDIFEIVTTKKDTGDFRILLSVIRR